MQYCECLSRRSKGKAVKDIFDEVIEFVKKPSKDEMSDIAFGIGRFIEAIIGVYVSIPGDRMHIEKINERMKMHGCIRSERAIAEGEGCV